MDGSAHAHAVRIISKKVLCCVCLSACAWVGGVRACANVSSPPAEMPAGTPERPGVGKETSRFCTMNDLLRQAHPNTLVPGGGWAPLAPTSRRETCPQAARGRASDSHVSLSRSIPLAR